MPRASHASERREKLLGTAIPIAAIAPTGSTPFFTGTFDSSLTNWPSRDGTCSSLVDSHQEQFAITSSCDPAGDGRYRTDLCSSASCGKNASESAGGVYQANTATCTTVPLKVTSGGTTRAWWQFAEAKDVEASNAGWELDLSDSTHLQVRFINYNSDAPAYTAALASGWNDISICTNNSTSSSGVVYGVYLNGNQLTATGGSQAGSTSLSGFGIITDGATSWPLDVNDYTGGTPVPNTIVHGAPLVSHASRNPPVPGASTVCLFGGWQCP